MCAFGEYELGGKRGDRAIHLQGVVGAAAVVDLAELDPVEPDLDGGPVEVASGGGLWGQQATGDEERGGGRGAGGRQPAPHAGAGRLARCPRRERADGPPGGYG